MRWATPREMTESSQPSSSSSSFAAPAAAVAEQEDKNGVVDVEGETEQQGVMGGHSGASTGGESLELPQRPSPAAASVAVQAPHRPLSTFAGVRLQLRPPLADASAAVEVPQPPPPAPAPPPPRIHLRPASHPPEAPAAVQSHQPARFVTTLSRNLESAQDGLRLGAATASYHCQRLIDSSPEHEQEKRQVGKEEVEEEDYSEFVCLFLSLP
uniref:Uncharacterized protein n=1 Tax=Chromera velia CCMP2878 TaxID=1169474 RepID=A0A0G4HRL3_9ALVE|eukprot:Cvel_8088.t1-p1 / transcript=Cvel_8088.t1 / gene=Cvel_8088 / organism=Chromera_velia_CCMP2878 / gene_product=hypothetical protein / transcript_product=hypothetical protein / location=Cvel_scaffold439:27862-32705(-) / protein_length=211 / sequence_SO=supercontig / SO=protein_coding / is_pseudo=false